MPMDKSPYDELTCMELVETVTDYFENALSPEEYTRVVEHLAECEGCERYVAQLRETVGALGALQVNEVSPQAHETLFELFREWKQDRSE